LSPRPRHGFTVTHTHDFGTSCLTCHDGVDRYGDFDHNQLSFVLTGEHLGAECSACHPDDRTIPDLQDTPTECEACHLSDDAHAGKYGAQCGLCHTPAGWIPAEFDHNLADFKLEGKHVDVPCESCHINGFKGTPRIVTPATNRMMSITVPLGLPAKPAITHPIGRMPHLITALPHLS